MKMELEIEGIEVFCILGERPAERVNEQRIIVDARLEIESAAAFSDKLEDTVDYVALADIIRSRLKAEKAMMLERAAFVAAKAALEFPQVIGAKIKVAKTGAVQEIARASAICSLDKKEDS